MTKTTAILDAVEFAVKAHSGQIRHWTNEPYVAHCIRVAKMVDAVGMDVDTTIAALLHDVLEDCPKVTRTEIFGGFGWRVLDMVEDLTDAPHSAGNRAQRKVLDRERLSQASAGAQTIKCADIIDNTSSICENDPGFGRLYLQEVTKCLEGLNKAHLALYDDACATVFDWKNRLEEEANVGC